MGDTDRFEVNVEGPESNSVDFVLGPYDAGRADAVKVELETTLRAHDPDFRVWVSRAATAATVDDVYEFFDITAPR